ncbi:hypothetical protein ON010_g11870 [Phytophthora cinnamomi]|nr:hypothetical protein ON010_g11870 [Phytophthora cinnamomi]
MFLDMVDLAMVNAFIVHKIGLKRRNKPIPTHAAFMKRLLTELPHSGEDRRDEWRQASTMVVQSVLCGAGVRNYETIYYSATCSREMKERVTLCNKPRRLEHGSALACDQVWHQSWTNSTAIPPQLQHKIKFVRKRRPEVAEEVEQEESES